MSVRPTPALGVAVFALLVALGGATYAVTALPKNSVGAAQIKKNAVTSKAVKNHSLKSKDIKPGQLGGEVYLKDGGSDAVDVTAVVGVPPDTLVNSMALPAGTFYVRATGYASNTHAALLGELRCFLRSSGDTVAAGTPGLYVPIEPDAGTNANRGFYSLDAAVKLKDPGTVRVECSKGAAAQVMQTGASISAVTTPKVHDVP
jgi:hypothetical protein